jgi:hypothetical protein
MIDRRRFIDRSVDLATCHPIGPAHEPRLLTISVTIRTDLRSTLISSTLAQAKALSLSLCEASLGNEEVETPQPRHNAAVIVKRKSDSGRRSGAQRWPLRDERRSLFRKITVRFGEALAV